MLVSVPPSDFAINKEKVSCHLRGKPRGSWPRGARNPPARGHKKSSLRSPDSKLQTTGPVRSEAIWIAGVCHCWCCLFGTWQ